MADLAENSPEFRPITFFQRIQFRIAGNHTAAEQPDLPFARQFRPRRICRDIKADFGERVPLPLFRPQNFILGLRLEFLGRKFRLKVSPQKCQAVDLI